MWCSRAEKIESSEKCDPFLSPKTHSFNQKNQSCESIGKANGVGLKPITYLLLLIYKYEFTRVLLPTAGMMLRLPTV